jgi:uncharacterized protein
MFNRRGLTPRSNIARVSSLFILSNIQSIADVIFGGVCHRFPRLRFVSVESGVGYLPGLLETFDWQWLNSGVQIEHPEYSLIPSEYFRRQIYGTFWFEQASARAALEGYEDNVMFESDFPHPTCQHPGPQSQGMHPREYVISTFASLPDRVIDKVLVATAARVYKLDLPPGHTRNTAAA